MATQNKKRITIDALAGMMNRAFEALELKFTSLEKKVDTGFSKVNQRFDKVGLRLDVIEGKNFNNHENRITALEQDARSIKKV